MIARLAGLILLAIVSTGAAAQVLYKWVDADGKTQYSDKPPKNFKGTVTRIEPEPAPLNAVPLLPKPVAAPAKAGTPGPVDLARERRERREALQARVDAAQAKVDAAKKALETGSESSESDRQAIQQNITPPNSGKGIGGGMHGMTGRGNCRKVKDAAGREALVCSSALLTEEYRERVTKLEESLAKAEEELARAEDDYRRGVD